MAPSSSRALNRHKVARSRSPEVTASDTALSPEWSTSAFKSACIKTMVSVSSKIAIDFPLRILVAEDNPVNQLLIKTLLKKLGYQPDLVSNGLEVLDALKRQPYDVILMDMLMPEMDGLETAKQIREIERSIRAEKQNAQNLPTTLASDTPIKIIALTANALKTHRDACLAAGMDDYLSKPLYLESLVEALLRCQVSA